MLHMSTLVMTSCSFVLISHRFGPRFPSITSAYDRELRKIAADTGKELGMEEFMRTGVYFYLSGPSYETAAECRMIRSLGGDSVGMSTAPEVVVARHCGMKVLGAQCICILKYFCISLHININFITKFLKWNFTFLRIFSDY